MSLPAFIEAFYTSTVFKLELVTVGLLFARRSSDQQAGQLARGEITTFSAWRVEDRNADQLLLHETISGKTRSWLKVEPVDDALGRRTRLYFGTAVLPVGTKTDGEPRMSRLFSLVGFHKVYAQMLLRGAEGRLNPAARRQFSAE